jgi:ABC-2 type transport system ATP-binding protein
VTEALALVNLTDRRRHLVKTYSGGMRRRLEIARGLMHRPEVLFLDEPTLGLDPQTRRRVWKYIESLKDSYGMTIILTTHYMDEADHLCSRIAIIDWGQIVGLGTPQALKATLGGDVLELSVAPIDPKFLKRLKSHDSVRSVHLQDGKLMLTVDEGESFLPKSFDVAHQMGVKISEVAVRKPNLEDVFIKLTGREIRDDGIKEARERRRIYRWGRRK